MLVQHLKRRWSNIKKRIQVKFIPELLRWPVRSLNFLVLASVMSFRQRTRQRHSTPSTRVHLRCVHLHLSSSKGNDHPSCGPCQRSSLSRPLLPIPSGRWMRPVDPTRWSDLRSAASGLPTWGAAGSKTATLFSVRARISKEPRWNKDRRRSKQGNEKSLEEEERR
jgi:hypothetical protein